MAAVGTSQIQTGITLIYPVDPGCYSKPPNTPHPRLANVSINPALRWRRDTPFTPILRGDGSCTNCPRYYIYFRKASEVTSKLIDSTYDTIYALTYGFYNLIPKTVYFWAIKGDNQPITREIASSAYFEVGLSPSEVYTSSVTIVSPPITIEASSIPAGYADTVRSNTLTVVWNSQNAAIINYHVKVTWTQNGSTWIGLILDTTLTDTTVLITKLFNSVQPGYMQPTTYFQCAVQAINSLDTSCACSGEFIFYVHITPTKIIKTTSHIQSNNLKTNATYYNLQGRVVSSAHLPRLYIKAVPGFSMLVRRN